MTVAVFALRFMTVRLLVAVRLLVTALRFMVTMSVMFVVLWWADWNMVGHWDLLVDWEFHFLVDDVWSVDWDLDFILWGEKKV